MQWQGRYISQHLYEKDTFPLRYTIAYDNIYHMHASTQAVITCHIKDENINYKLQTNATGL